VVASMADIVRREIARTHPEHVTLLGHSGGGTLALLLAQRVPQVDRVVTIAGNLDPVAWTRLHGYQPLVGSLDPAEQAAPRSSLVLTHYAGGADQNIPPEMIQRAARRVGGSVIVVPGFTHTCCWARIWPEILSTAN
jgi:dienelactone hydrolase